MSRHLLWDADARTTNPMVRRTSALITVAEMEAWRRSLGDREAQLIEALESGQLALYNRQSRP